MALTCQACNAPIHDEDVNIPRRIAKCRSCHAITRIPAAFPPKEDELDEPEDALQEKPQSQPPRGYRVENTGATLVIVKRWLTCVFPILIFLFFFLGLILSGIVDADITPPALKMGLLCLLGFFVLFSGYAALAVLFNRTVITVEKDRLTVRHGPVPWPGNCKVATDQIRELACRESTVGDSNQSVYTVYAVYRSGDRKRLTGSLNNRAEAQFIVEQVERFLRLEERAEEPDIPKSEVQPPARIRIEESGDGLRIVWRWRTRGTLLLAFFFFAFWGGGSYWLFTTDVAWAVSLRANIFVILGLAAIILPGAYMSLGRLINRTVISVDSERLAVKHGPLPWAGNRAIAVGDVKQLYCEQKTHRAGENDVRHTWDLNAVTVGGVQVRLLTELADKNQGLYIEQEVERYLGIKDEAVGGEAVG